MVDSITLSVESGTIHGLLGFNGAGKTTFMKLLSVIYRPDDGCRRNYNFNESGIQYSGNRMISCVCRI
ncbi:ATP-binding cassette domain-containing protein [Salinicoccus siamensis]|uniref:ATP-binding cassette domain-containing protein n=1 Tax=Salinicoccus siamensis TaxID=381830 RepID=A0ABV5Z0E3_9STAP